MSTKDCTRPDGCPCRDVTSCDARGIGICIPSVFFRTSAAPGCLLPACGLPVPAVVALVGEPPHPVAVLEVAHVAPRLVGVEPQVQQRLVHGVPLSRLHLGSSEFVDVGQSKQSMRNIIS